MVAMDKSRRVETWMNEVDALRQNVERKKLIEEKTVKEILNFELENDEISENIKLLNEKLSLLTQGGFKERNIIHLHNVSGARENSEFQSIHPLNSVFGIFNTFASL